MERVAYQYAIEEIYWRHRIWPKENARPKPSLNQVVSRTQIEQRVQTYLRDSQLLADKWQRPITPDQLQAEMDRMASHSKQPEVLKEIFNVLGNDPTLIAECLVRPVLSERLVRELYAHDESLHGALKQRAESELRTHPGIKEMKQTSGTYSEIELVRSDSAQDKETGGSASLEHDGKANRQRRDTERAVKMNSGEWNETLQKLAAIFGNPKNGRARLPGTPITQMKTGILSSLQEDDSYYYATAVLEKGKDR